MPFVKLDCKMLDSSLWPEKDQRDLFITALLMAEPVELTQPTKQIKVRSLDYTGFEAPPGWYGFIPAAGIGIIHRCGMEQEVGLNALEALGNPDPESRSNDFEGRRLIRIDGGYLALNYDKYRERDYSNAERCKRYREKKKSKDMPCQPLQHACQHVSDMQAEAEEEVYKNKKSSAKASSESLNVKIPESLSTESFMVVWNDWVSFRRTLRKSKDWNVFFTKQLAELEKWGVEAAIVSMKQSILNEYQGLFFPKNMKPSDKSISKPHSIEDHLKAQGVK